jgi:hypothetical protein
LGEQHRRGHGAASHVPTGQAAEQDRQLADEGQCVHGQQGVHFAAEPGTVDQDQGLEAGRVGEGQPEGDGAAGGVSDHVQPTDAEGVEKVGDERSGVAAGGVGAGMRGVAVAGQAQREYAVGAGKGGDDPSPARRALLVSVQQQERRPGAGLEVLGCESVDGDAGWADGFNPRSRRTGW